ncbi:DinB family protein [Gordonia sp. L191]|uniref:DinB family protein n=1 Tax=Gordonia sp. L191 TaxID=2982699 RepID=UPI0024C0A4C1|nr:DinB family protein [Gordonia sp. L191]WHU47733.1 DinB family protein [Gordonia sp. L191]
MTSPHPNRTRRKDTPPPSTGASEKEVLTGFLNYLRQSAAGKLRGLDEEAARTTHVPSGTTLAGLIQHLAYVERAMFLGETVTSWPQTFRVPPEAKIDDIVDSYRAVVGQANDVIDTYDDLSLPAPRLEGRTSGPSMRWALTHMIEETGRHVGHLDILRELTDGTVGR